VSVGRLGELGTSVSEERSISEDARLPATICSIMSIVLAGETGRLPGIGSRAVANGADAMSIERDGVCGEVWESISLACVSGEKFSAEVCSHQSVKVSEAASDFVSEDTDDRAVLGCMIG
jgi:hypothetical protein